MCCAVCVCVLRVLDQLTFTYIVLMVSIGRVYARCALFTWNVHTAQHIEHTQREHRRWFFFSFLICSQLACCTQLRSIAIVAVSYFDRFGVVCDFTALLLRRPLLSTRSDLLNLFIHFNSESIFCSRYAAVARRKCRFRWFRRNNKKRIPNGCQLFHLITVFHNFMHATYIFRLVDQNRRAQTTNTVAMSV